MEPEELADDLRLWSESADAWLANVPVDSNRVFIDPFVRAALPVGPGTKVLDVGCGEGRFGRILAADGALVTGVEPTKALRERAIESGGYVQVLDALAGSLPFADACFDAVLFYLILIDVRNFRDAINEAARVLVPGGRLVVANIVPMRSASDRRWLREGDKRYWTIEYYAAEREQVLEWSGIKIRNYHRPLTAYLDAYAAAGFALESYRELIPTLEQVAADPGRAVDRLVPNFDLTVLRKK
ncbi:putative methyltransferase [Hyaloraphidium curvatum]|nr:putative methyltransferase [Hyaloraphidium curvatum]